MSSGYYNSKESVQEYIESAKDTDGRELIEELGRVLVSNSSLLEIGTGPGNDWKILFKIYNVVGSDTSVEFLNYFKSTYPDGIFMNIDATHLEMDQEFNGIYSNKVLHLLNDEDLKKSIIRQHEILEDSGIIRHSFWNGEGSELFQGLFVNYANETKLNLFFGKYFQILSIICYDEFDVGDSLLLIARKGVLFEKMLFMHVHINKNVFLL